MTTRKPISPKLVHETFKRDGFRCVHCGRSANDGIILELDHIIPVAGGGTNDPGNLQTLCRRCNRGKSDTHPGDYSFTTNNFNKKENLMAHPGVILGIILVSAKASVMAIETVGTMLREGGEGWNVKFKTMGGKMYWKTLAEKHGWKVQQNILFKNCRILDPNNYRIAWGGGGALDTFLEQMPVLADAYAEAIANTEAEGSPLQFENKQA